MKTEERNKKIKKKFYIKKSIGLLLVLLLAFGILKIYWPKIRNPRIEDVKTVSKSSLEKILEISDLSTLDYSYNAVVDVKDENGKVKYNLAYEGEVTSGIDFSKIAIDTDDEEKVIHILIPQAEIQEVRVDTGTMDYIFEKKSFETETVTEEAYKKAIEDLEKRASMDSNLLNMANENALDTVKALIEPWLNELDGEYRMEVEIDEK